MSLRILHQDEHLVAIDKPQGFHVHPPEDARIRISPQINCLKILSDQLSRFVYPLHRIDAATSGIVLYAFDRETASRGGALFRERAVTKRYFAITRGWIHESSMVIDRPLKAEAGSQGPQIDARTEVSLLARLELPFAVGPHASARYSLIEAKPVTGRRHQIRRHLSGASHPLVGDTIHGDGRHNRFFREELGLEGLWLHAWRQEFVHPRTGEPLVVQARWPGRWHQMFDRFGVCPWSRFPVE